MAISSRQLLAALTAAALGLVAIGCQNEFTVEATRPSVQAFVLSPSDTPSAQIHRSMEVQGADADEQPEPGGKLIYDAYCASCHGDDGRGGYTADGRATPDLVTFGAPLIEPFIYDPAVLTVEFASLQSRQARYQRVAEQLTALQEGQGANAGRGKKVHTPRHWYESVCGDPDVVRTRMDPATASYHLDPAAGALFEFDPEKHGRDEAASLGISAEQIGGLPLGAQERWDAVFYLWSLSADIQVLQGGGYTFQRFCNVCHGRKALGDGPEGHGFEPKPRNFSIFEWSTDKSNERWFTSIRNGRVATGMPPWEVVLTENDMWQIVEYLRTYSYKTTYEWVEKLPY